MGSWWSCLSVPEDVAQAQAVGQRGVQPAVVPDPAQATRTDAKEEVWYYLQPTRKTMYVYSWRAGDSWECKCSAKWIRGYCTDEEYELGARESWSVVNFADSVLCPAFWGRRYECECGAVWISQDALSV